MKIFDDLSPRQLQLEVDQACDVFKRFNHQLEDGQETFNWLLHFRHKASCLVIPLLQHFAQVVKQKHGRYLPTSEGADLEDLELQHFSEVAQLCYKNLQTLAGHNATGEIADAEVWRLAVAEFKKPESKTAPKAPQVVGSNA